MTRESDPIRVVLAENHGLVGMALRLLLADMPGVEVVGQEESLEQTRKCVAQLLPDVLVLDLGLSDGFALKAVPELARDVPVIVLTLRETPAFAVEAIERGASACILKDAAAEELEQAIGTAVRRQELRASPTN